MVNFSNSASSRYLLYWGCGCGCERMNCPTLMTWQVLSLNTSSTQRFPFAFAVMIFNLLKCALGVGQVASKQSDWLIPGDDKTKGHQIDLVIDRADRVVNLCEIKCYNDEFTVTAEYAMTIRGRVNAIKDHISKRSSIQPTLVTTFGLKPGKNSSVFTRTITLDDLFK